jgi:hypothetical protein
MKAYTVKASEFSPEVVKLLNNHITCCETFKGQAFQLETTEAELGKDNFMLLVSEIANRFHSIDLISRLGIFTDLTLMQADVDNNYMKLVFTFDGIAKISTWELSQNTELYYVKNFMLTFVDREVLMKRLGGEVNVLIHASYDVMHVPRATHPEYPGVITIVPTPRKGKVMFKNIDVLAAVKDQ